MSTNANRRLLVLAILAFDLILQDCLEDERMGEDYHPISKRLLMHLESLLNNKPDLDELRQEYILNVSDMSSRIQLLFMSSRATDDELLTIIELQKEKLTILSGGWIEEAPDDAEMAVRRNRLN